MPLKYEHIQPGTRIRAYDFEPRDGVDERYVEGVVLRHDEMSSGARSLVIMADVDTTWPSEQYQGKSYTRIGVEVHVPMQMGLGEYEGRVKVCTERCDL